jgi:hypothetical protein
MVSTLDIFGLAVGLLYTVFAPIAAYFVLREPRQCGRGMSR